MPAGRGIGSRSLGALRIRSTRLPGYLWAARLLTASRCPILNYHGVTDRPLRTFNWCHVPARAFEWQMRYLAEHYTVIHLSEVLDRLSRGESLPRRSACVTFDDGFRTVATTAFAILHRYQIPSTVFLVTSIVGTRQPAWPDRLFHWLSESKRSVVTFRGTQYRLTCEDGRAGTYRTLCDQLKNMRHDDCERLLGNLEEQLDVGPVPDESPLATLDWDEVHQLARTGLIEFGSHTHTHPILSRCALDVQRRELQVSRDILHDRGLIRPTVCVSERRRDRLYR